MGILTKLPVRLQSLQVLDHFDQLRCQVVDIALEIGQRQIDISKIIQKFRYLIHFDLQTAGKS